MCAVDPLRLPRDTLYQQKLALTSPTSGGHSVGVVHLPTKATEVGGGSAVVLEVCDLLRIL
jgi:hypothetical protein